MKKLVNRMTDRTLIAIDPATHSLAFAVVECKNGEVYLRSNGKLNMRGCDDSEKFSRINAFVPMLIQSFNPSLLVIEQPIYIQNFQTSRSLSYVVGYTWGRFNQERIKIMDIGPMQWKSGIGYQKVSAKEKQEWARSMSLTDVKKKADFERKNRVKEILSKKFDISSIEDNDIVDAIGIAYWAVYNT